MKKLLAAVTPLLMLASCVPSTPQARIQQSPGKFEALGEKHRALVERGEITRGMTMDAVYLAWGSPSATFQGSKNGRTTERWDYASSRPVTVTTFHGGYYGYGYGPYGRRGYDDLAFGFGPEVAYVPYRVASVWFVDSRVDSWERAR